MNVSLLFSIWPHRYHSGGIVVFLMAFFSGSFLISPPKDRVRHFVSVGGDGSTGSPVVLHRHF